MRRFQVLFSAVLIGLMSFSAPTHAASIIAWDVSTLTNESSVVVDATVESVVSTRHTDGSITTRSELRVHEALKGSARKTLVLHQLGGTVGEWTLSIPGDLLLTEGQRVVLFASEDAGRMYPTLLAWSGFFVEGEGLAAPVRRSMKGLTLFDQDEFGVLRPVESPLLSPKTLGELRSAVLQTVQGGR